MNDFLTIEEMQSVLYEYQMNEITENNEAIVEDAIMSAIEEVKSYFVASNQRKYMLSLTPQQMAYYPTYDVEAIFSATGNDRNSHVLRITKRIAAYNVCELALVDVMFEHVKKRYDDSIKTLEKIAGMGDFANSQLFLTNLPQIEPEPGTQPPLPFRTGSSPKFTHE